MSRPIRPRAAIPITPACVTQRTCEATLGLDERRYLDLYRSHPRARRVGRLLVLELADAIEHLRSMPAATPTDDVDVIDEDDDRDDEITTADDVLRSIGYRRLAARNGRAAG